MTTTPELEAVARAIYAAMHGEDDAVWDDLEQGDKEPALKAAQAALLAIREPTERMLNAMSDAGDTNSIHTAHDVHHAMIDYVLGDKP